MSGAIGHTDVVLSRMRHIVTGAAVGALAWTATEYSTHRWVLHGPFSNGTLSRIPIGSLHRTHHAKPEHTVPLARVAANLGVFSAAAIAASAASAAVPAAAAWAGCLSFGAGYSTYDIVHHRLHHRPPTNALGLRMRQRHFRHHFGTPKRNLGVTHGFWDRLANTEAAHGPVRVPSKLAPSWLDQLGPDFVAA